MHCGINAQYLAAAAQIALPHQRRILRSAGAKCFAFESQKCVEYGATEGPNTLRHWRRIGAVPAQNMVSKWQKFRSAAAQKHPSDGAVDLAPVGQKTFMQRRRMSCKAGRNTLRQWRRKARINLVQYFAMVARNPCGARAKYIAVHWHCKVFCASRARIAALRSYARASCRTFRGTARYSAPQPQGILRCRCKVFCVTAAWSSAPPRCRIHCGASAWYFIAPKHKNFNDRRRMPCGNAAGYFALPSKNTLLAWHRIL